ncbi:MAG: pseudouridylate synthase [Herbaspirillum sp.]|jgi:23S rRNA pseudouridine2604 synthase|nr:pseudouridylate synthase [Herbaspirillum sp.]
MTESVRLSKRMSELGLCSRREADEWIERGWVRVDGSVVAVLGSKVLPHQKITVERQAAAEQSKRATILLNKPVGYVSGQAEDGHKHAISLITPQTHWAEDRSTTLFHPTQLRSLVAAGRLDIDSVGLLVLTQDGRIAKQLIGEDSSVEKEYLVRVAYGKAGRLPDSDLKLLNHGLTLDGKPLKPAKVRWQNDDQLNFTLREGKKRQIRRMCEAVGLKVLGLKRVRIGGVKLSDLPEGQWRYLTPDEDFEAEPKGLPPQNRASAGAPGKPHGAAPGRRFETEKENGPRPARGHVKTEAKPRAAPPAIADKPAAETAPSLSGKTLKLPAKNRTARR